MLLIIFYIFILSFVILLLIIKTAPEYIEKEDGSLVPKKKAKEKLEKSSGNFN